MHSFFMFIGRAGPRCLRGIMLAIAFLLETTAPAQTPAPVYSWTTAAGRASLGWDDGPVDRARFNGPCGLAADALGNIYVADTGNHTIRKITPAGIVSTLAGSPDEWGSVDGVGADARFDNPQGVAVDAAGNVYVADTGNHTIRCVSPAGVVTTIAGRVGVAGTADGPVGDARFSSPKWIATDRTGTVYVSDHGIRKITGGTVQTIYSGGPVSTPSGTETATLADSIHNAVAVDATGRVIFTASLAKDGGYGGPSNAVLALDASGNVSLLFSNRSVTFTSGLPVEQYWFWQNITGFGALAFDNAGNLLVTTYREYGFVPCSVSVVAPDGTGLHGYNVLSEDGICASDTAGVVSDGHGNVLFTRHLEGWPRSIDNAVIRFTPDGKMATWAGTPVQQRGVDGTGEAARFANLGHLFIDAGNRVWATDVWLFQGDSYLAADSSLGLRRISPAGEVTTPIRPFWHEDVSYRSWGVAGDTSGNVFIGALYSDALYTQQVDSSGTVGALQYSTPLSFSSPGGFIVDPAGNLVATDGGSHVLRVRGAEGKWTILAGADNQAGTADGNRTEARFGTCSSPTIDPAGNIYVLDAQRSAVSPSSVIRKISPTGTVSTVSANLMRGEETPSGLAVDRHGNFFLTYSVDQTVWRLDSTGTMASIGGVATRYGSADGTGQSARFSAPSYAAVDAQDNLYVIDGYGSTIRKGQLAGSAPAIATQPQSQSAGAGQSVQFSVVTTGTPAPSYQWYFNGSAISGASANTYTIPSVQAANAGDYTVKVANSTGDVTSNKASLTVSAAATPSANSGSGGAGGGGALDGWFVLSLLGLGSAYAVTRSRRTVPQRSAFKSV